MVVAPLGLLLTSVDWDPLVDADAAFSAELVESGRDGDVDVLRALTAIGGAPVRAAVLAPVAAWLAWRRRWRLVVFVVAGGALVGAVNELLKRVFDRPRPAFDAAVDASGFSYPSGHASGTAATATVLVLVFWPVLTRAGRCVSIVLAVVAAAVVGYSRVALGVHFGTDVVAGWCVGVAWVLLLAVALRVWPGQPAALTKP